MNEQLKGLLAQVSDGSLDITQAQQQIESLYFTDLGHTVLDMDRERRTGHGEVVYCAGKSVSQIHDILSHLDTSGINVLATRLDEVIWQQLAPPSPMLPMMHPRGSVPSSILSPGAVPKAI